MIKINRKGRSLVRTGVAVLPSRAAESNKQQNWFIEWKNWLSALKRLINVPLLLNTLGFEKVHKFNGFIYDALSPEPYTRRITFLIPVQDGRYDFSPREPNIVATPFNLDPVCSNLINCVENDLSVSLRKERFCECL
jgi:hypothetical protein